CSSSRRKRRGAPASASSTPQVAPPGTRTGTSSNETTPWSRSRPDHSKPSAARTSSSATARPVRKARPGGEAVPAGSAARPTTPDIQPTPARTSRSPAPGRCCRTWARSTPRPAAAWAAASASSASRSKPSVSARAPKDVTKACCRAAPDSAAGSMSCCAMGAAGPEGPVNY
ncbi:MAG: hypothetical protein AVDCRST_MAG08-925, partial [uncultured Acetobacteraceae bacterium]